MNIEKIKTSAQKYLPEQVDLLKRFVTVDSESKYVEGNRQVVDMARDILAGIPGVTMEEIFFEGTGSHLIARIKPENPKGKIILNSHMDTVFPVGYAAKYPPFIDDENWLHGLGVGDCKAGFAVSAYAVKIAAEQGLLPNKEIVMLYSCDEEIGSITSREVFAKEAPGTECAYIFESAAKTDKGYGVVTARRGVILGALDIKGVEAHAGGAYLVGHSATKELAHKILKLYSFNDYERKIYYNVAPISGGRPNGIVAGDAHMEFCCAGLPDNSSSFAEAEANIESLAAHNEDPVCETTVSHRILFPALEKNEAGHQAFTIAEKAGKLLGITMEEIAEPTATDANWFYYYGVPAVDAFGPVESGMHTTEEKVYIPTIAEKTALFATMLGIMAEEG
ncbi:MAG: M20/M25/M40 family metallo-hydrolase [Lachnospiraceae bacterium]|nr:M20/M25/M40 family metallo-hydrolase [Lachnospiraceae bacterium]